MNKTFKLFAVLNVCMILALSAYALAPFNSGHVGNEPLFMVVYFGAIALLSAALMIINNDIKKNAMRNITISVIGLLLVLFFDATNMLVQYDRWAKRGLPSKGDISWLRH